MKFYIASSLKNHEQVHKLSSILIKAGWLHTYDWTSEISTKVADTEILKRIGENEYKGVKEADIVIVLSPQGKGTHTELGIAIGLNKKIYLCHSDDRSFKCDDNTSTFYWLPQVKQFMGDTEDIAKELLSLN